MGKKQGANKKNNRKGVEQRTIQQGSQYILASKRLTKPTKPNKTNLLKNPPKVKKIKKPKNQLPKNQLKPIQVVQKKIEKKITKGTKTKQIKKASKSKNKLRKKSSDNYQRKIKIRKPTKNVAQEMRIDIDIENEDMRESIDLCFCVDTSGSMIQAIMKLKEGLEQLQILIKQIQTQIGKKIRIAIVSYRDHSQNEAPVRIHDFTNCIQAFWHLKSLVAWGRGTGAVHDALLSACDKLSWDQNNKQNRFIAHILDQPPHGNEFQPLEQQQGCICGLKTDRVLEQINSKNIKYKLIQVGEAENLNNMQKIFQQHINNFQIVSSKSPGQLFSALQQVIRFLHSP